MSKNSIQVCQSMWIILLT